MVELVEEEDVSSIAEYIKYSVGVRSCIACRRSWQFLEKRGMYVPEAASRYIVGGSTRKTISILSLWGSDIARTMSPVLKF